MQHIEDLTHRIEFKCTLEPQINEEVVTNSSVKSDVNRTGFVGDSLFKLGYLT